MALPDLTPQQRAQALEKATRARRRRAEVKDALKSRKITLSEVIDMAATDDAIAKMKVRSLLEALPRVGVSTAEALMNEIKIAPSRRVRGLGQVQREELIRRFGRTFKPAVAAYRHVFIYGYCHCRSHGCW